MHAAPPSRVALVPNAIAFRDAEHGIAGTGWKSCGTRACRGRPEGTISVTTDGGRTWRVLRQTPRPVVSVGIATGEEWAVLDDGETLVSRDGGRSWQPSAPRGIPGVPCDPSTPVSPAQVAVTATGVWALCVGQGGAGSENKSVYRYLWSTRRWKRLAWTTGRASGGISSYGYPLGIAMSDSGFGLIWESRGTLYVTRDGGSQWVGLPKVARPEIDFGWSAVALRHGVGFALLALEGGEVRRLIATRDEGRTWHVVHRWR